MIRAPAMEAGQVITVGPSQSCSASLKSRLSRVGHRAKVLAYSEDSKHWPGKPAVWLKGLVMDPRGRETDERGFQAWFPVDALAIEGEVIQAKQGTLDVYEAMDAKTRTELRRAGERIRSLAGKVVSSIVDVGRELCAVKEQIEHGQFEAWCDQELGWSGPTCRRYMAVARAFPEIVHSERFDAAALYLLASPSAPEQARMHALAVAGRGEPVTLERAREILGLFVEPSAPDLMRPLKTATSAAARTIEHLRAWRGVPADLVERAEQLHAEISALLGEAA